MVLETDNVGDVKLLHQQPDEVDAVSFGFTLFIQVGIRPYTFRILEDKRLLSRICPSAVRLGGNVGG
jgi:hypothetical protein